MFQLGMFAAIWGQIDFLLSLSIAALLKTDFNAAETLMGSMTTGPRLGLFNKLIREKIEDEDIRKVSKEFSETLGSIIDGRNYIMHGMWGEVISNNKSIGAGVRHPKQRNITMASDMPAMILKASKATHLIAKLANKFTRLNWEYNPSNPPIFFIKE